MAQTKNSKTVSKSRAGFSRDVEVIGAVGKARFRMTPLDIQRVQDLFEAHDALHAIKIAA